MSCVAPEKSLGLSETEKDMTYIRDAVDKVRSLAPDMMSPRGKENQHFEANLCSSLPWARFLDSLSLEKSFPQRPTHRSCMTNNCDWL